MICDAGVCASGFQKAMRNALFNCRPRSDGLAKSPRELWYHDTEGGEDRWLPVYWTFFEDLYTYDQAFHLHARTAFRLTKECVKLDVFSKMRMSLVHQVC